MIRLRAAFAALALLLAGGAGAEPAGLRLHLQDAGLAPAERQASQALLDEALAALPPRLRE